MKTILKAILLVFVTMASGEVLADWDFEPVPINLASNPGDLNVHYVQGGRRIVRIQNTILALAPIGARDHIYRSTDNGANWRQLENNPLNTFSSCLLSGSNETVFHFFRNGNRVYMVKFRYDAAPPAPIIIYTDSNLNYTSHGAYSRVVGTVDRDGVIFVAVHGNAAGSDASNHDAIYLIKSEDHGTTWTPSGQASVVRQGNADHSWGFMHMDVSRGNALLCTYAAWNSEALELAISSDRGRSWKTTRLASGDIYNPAVLPVNDNEIYIFAQSSLSDGAIRGLVFTKSQDSGATWSGWQTIDGSSVAGYGDPSCGLGSDGAIYVAYRSGARPDLIGTLNGEALRERLAMSADGGRSWRFPDDYFYDRDGAPTARCGTQSQIRYQTWFNYGGPLEWIWLQYEDPSGTQRPVYYDLNTDVEIWNHPPTGVQAPAAPTNFRIISGP
jgi:hypothetical protein